ncbi:MAG: hypothetical protein ABJM26_01960 [Anderseniella sp.]
MSNLMHPMEHYGITRQRGFVPATDPLQRLPESCAVIDRISTELAVHVKQQSLGKAICDIGNLDLDLLNGKAEQERLFLALCVLANAWIWGQAEPDFRIPQPLAVPMVKLGSSLKRKATLTYASMAFFNWEKIDPAGKVSAENTKLLCGFLGTRDETWFVTSALHLEVACAPLLADLYDAVVLSLREDSDGLQQKLTSLAEQMHVMTDAVLKVREQCDPVIFYNSVRPFFTGWPSPGVIYEGISETPSILAGASAAQSPLIQAFDAALGIRHNRNTAAFLDSMKPYMMAEHRRFISEVRSVSAIRDLVTRSGSAVTRSAYNSITGSLNEFRRRHFQLVTDYVTKPSRQKISTGTGGSFYSEILRDAGAATKDACLPVNKRP